MKTWLVQTSLRLRQLATWWAITPLNNATTAAMCVDNNAHEMPRQFSLEVCSEVVFG
jgi:hypothetical protein